MENPKTLEILKQAIIMEKRGYAFYSKVAEQTNDPDVKNIFVIMANEEVLHSKFLAEQFAYYDKENKFVEVVFPEEDAVTEMVLSSEIKNKIAAAGFEAAAIAAAVDFESRAIDVYTKQAEAATDPNEKKLYAWLSDWEKGHHKFLYELDQDLKERVWYDNQFWPF